MKKSSFVEGTIIATLAIFIVKILGMLYVIPFYAMVSVQASALYAYAYNIYVIFLDISSAGLPIAISKIVGEYETLGKMEAKQRAYNIGKKIILFASITVFMILILFAPTIARVLLGDLTGGNTVEDVALAIRCVSLSILVVPFLSVSKGYLQGHKIINVSSISQVIEQIIRILVILVGCYVTLRIFHLSERTAICVAVTGAFFGALIAQAYILKKMHDYKNELGIKKYEEKDNVTNKEIIKKIISYAVPFIIINTIYSLYNFIDMVLILRTMNLIGMPATDVEFITSSITTWSGKISMIITSIAMGMTVSLIPTIVEAYTLKNYKEVNNKLNQALQIIIMVSLPMAIGLALLSKSVWNIFYGLGNSFGPPILAIVVFVNLMGNIFMITSSTLQALNKYKLVYISTIIGLVTNAILDMPIMLLFNKIGIPSFLGASTASIIGYSISSIYALYVLKKEHALQYGNTFKLLKKLLLPLILMVAGVMLCMKIIPINYDSKFSTVIYIAINSIVGAFIYLFILYKKGILSSVLGENLMNKITSKMPFLKSKAK